MIDLKEKKEAILNEMIKLITRRKTLAPFDPEHYEIDARLDEMYNNYRIILRNENR